MDRKRASAIQFVITAVVAAIAALIVAAGAAADGATIAPDREPAAGTAHARPADAGFARALKVRYLSCERSAAAAALDAAAVMACSVVFEELKHSVFGGSFDALLAWWQDAHRESWRGREAGPRSPLS